MEAQSEQVSRFPEKLQPFISIGTKDSVRAETFIEVLPPSMVVAGGTTSREVRLRVGPIRVQNWLCYLNCCGVGLLKDVWKRENLQAEVLDR